MERRLNRAVRDDGIPGWPRVELATALRECDSRALHAFYTHFRPVLGERARLFGIQRELRAETVDTFLGDLLLSLCSARELPGSLYGYVFVSFKRFVWRAKRDRAREEVKALEAAANSAETTAVTSNPAIARFGSLLLSELSAEDRMLINAKAEEVPLREVAALLGMNYNAANTRVFRLRSKLRRTAAKAVCQLDPQDRRIVERLLRRAGDHSATSEAPMRTSRTHPNLQAGGTDHG